ncbi:MAG: hypothetical protein ABSH20_27275 [Tepidisphaeraceae bacterium]
MTVAPGDSTLRVDGCGVSAVGLRATSKAVLAGRRRVAVIGAKGLPVDACASWSEPFVNVADYEVLVIRPPQSLAELGPNFRNLHLLRERIFTLLDSGGVVYVIATPETSIEVPHDGTRLGGYSIGSYAWCPIQFEVVADSGQTRDGVDPRLDWYFKRIPKWEFVVKNPEFQKVESESEAPRFDQYRRQLLARNRYGEALALSIRRTPFAGRPRAGVIVPINIQDYEWQKLGDESGEMVVLPLSSPWTANDAIAGLLENVFGLAGASPVPEWLKESDYPRTPSQDAVTARLESEISRSQLELKAVVAERAELREAVGLLYESGPRLEELVAGALRELGVELGAAVGREEFTATFDGQLAAVEVKGNSKSASQDDYRALFDYLTTHDLQGVKGSRGILVVCAWRNKPLGERPAIEGGWFPDNVVTTAKSQGRVSLVATDTLYRVLLRFRAGDGAATEEFLRAMFSKSGVALDNF